MNRRVLLLPQLNLDATSFSLGGGAAAAGPAANDGAEMPDAPITEVDTDRAHMQASLDAMAMANRSDGSRSAPLPARDPGNIWQDILNLIDVKRETANGADLARYRQLLVSARDNRVPLYLDNAVRPAQGSV